MEYYKNLELADIVYFCELDLIWKTEEWKDIPDYVGVYKASDLGRVKSLFRYVKHSYGGLKPTKECILSQSISGKTYLNVGLCKNGKCKPTNVHIILAITFLNHKPNRYTKIVDHKDNNPLNTILQNIQIITSRHNNSKDKKNCSSKYTGVFYREKYNHWRSVIRINNNHRVELGVFKSEELASKCYQTALLNLEKYNGDNSDFRTLIKSLLND